MPQTITLDEKLAISIKSAELREAGDEEGAMRLIRTIPFIKALTKPFPTIQNTA